MVDSELDLKRKDHLKVLARKKSQDMKICVLGAGHGGLAMAGHLSIMGFRVNLYDRSRKRIRPVTARGGIKVEGEIHGFGKVERASNDIQACLKGVDCLMVAVSTMGHRFTAQICSRFLREKQIVVLNPGKTGGALEFLHILKENGVKHLPLIAEAQDFLYNSRSLGPAHVRIFSIKNSVPLATLPKTWSQRVLKVINKLYPQFIPGDNIIKTSFDNVETFIHPALAVLCASWIEDTHGDFKYYIQGASESVAKVLEKLDKERLEVAAALGFKAISMREWLYTAYSANGKNLYEAIHDNPGFLGIRAPDRLRHRYIDEDIPMSLVPLASIGAMFKVQTPTINSIIQLASIMRGRDFFSEGRTIERMGLKGKSAKEIRSIVLEGKE